MLRSRRKIRLTDSEDALLITDFENNAFMTDTRVEKSSSSAGSFQIAWKWLGRTTIAMVSNGRRDCTVCIAAFSFGHSSIRIGEEGKVFTVKKTGRESSGYRR